MIEDKNRIYDGFMTLESGVDSGRTPNSIDTNQVASAESMVFRRGRASTRPGISIPGTTETTPPETPTPSTTPAPAASPQGTYQDVLATTLYQVYRRMH